MPLEHKMAEGIDIYNLKYFKGTFLLQLLCCYHNEVASQLVEALSKITDLQNNL